MRSMLNSPRAPSGSLLVAGHFTEGRKELFQRDEIFGKRKMHVDFGSSEDAREPAHAQRENAVKEPFAEELVRTPGGKHIPIHGQNLLQSFVKNQMITCNETLNNGILDVSL